MSCKFIVLGLFWGYNKGFGIWRKRRPGGNRYLKHFKFILTHSPSLMSCHFKPHPVILSYPIHILICADLRNFIPNRKFNTIKSSTWRYVSTDLFHPCIKTSVKATIPCVVSCPSAQKLYNTGKHYISMSKLFQTKIPHFSFSPCTCTTCSTIAVL